MPAPNLPLFTDPADYSPEERSRAVAALLAAGLLRRRRPLLEPMSAPVPGAENDQDSPPNQVDVPSEQSVTVHAG